MWRSIKHVGLFYWLVDSKDNFKNDFQFLGMTFAMKSILGPKWELTQNVGTKSALLPCFYSNLSKCRTRVNEAQSSELLSKPQASKQQ